MQSNLSKTMVENVYECYKFEGVHGFYKGMGFPLATVPILNAIVFSTNEVCKILLGYQNENSLLEGTITGSIAGLANSVVVTPVELVKCRLQVQTENSTNARYKGIADCLSQIYREKGVRGIYQGNVITIIREVFGYGTQFGSYYFVKNLLSKITNKKISELNNLCLMFAGALSGVICWFFSFPQDVIKTRIQLDIDGSKFRKRFDGGTIDCTKYLYMTKGIKIYILILIGIRGFWVGFLPQTYQAIIGNAILFLIYENSKYYLFKF